MCDPEGTGVPSIFKTIRSAAALTRMLPILDLSCEENVTRRKWKLVRVNRSYKNLHSFLLQQNKKKGEGQGKYVTFSTMMHKEVSESFEMTTHHVPLRQMID